MSSTKLLCDISQVTSPLWGLDSMLPGLSCGPGVGTTLAPPLCREICYYTPTHLLPHTLTTGILPLARVERSKDRHVTRAGQRPSQRLSIRNKGQTTPLWRPRHRVRFRSCSGSVQLTGGRRASKRKANLQRGEVEPWRTSNPSNPAQPLPGLPDLWRREPTNFPLGLSRSKLGFHHLQLTRY